MKTIEKINAATFKLTFLSLHFFIFSFFSQKPIPNLNYLTTENGLSQAHNLDIFKDSQGFLWLSSYDGLNRFDGNKIKKYTQIYGDGKSFFGTLSNGIVEDSLGNIWSGSNDCINILNKNKNYFKHIRVKDSKTTLYKPLFSINEFVFFQKESNYYKCNINTFEITLIFKDKTEAFLNHLSHVVEINGKIIVFQTNKDRLGNIFEKTKFKVLVFSKNKLNCETFFYNNKAFYGINQVEVYNNNLLLATYEGLKLFDIKNNSIKNFNRQELNQPILAISAYDDNQYFFINDQAECYTLDKKLSTVEKHVFSNEEDLLELKKKGVRQIFIDDEQNVFLSIWGKGVAYFNFKNNYFKSSFNKFQFNNKIINDRYICSIANHDDFGVWIATRTGGLYHTDKNGQIIKHIPYPKKLKEIGYSGDIYLFNGYNNDLLIATTAGFFCFKKNTQEIKEININNLHPQLAFYDVILWEKEQYLISSNFGVVLTDQSFKQIKKPEGLPNKGKHIRAFALNDMYVVTCEGYKGFEVYKKTNDTFKKYDTYNINASIKAMHYVDDNEIYFASTVGLIKYDLKSKIKILDNHPNKWVNTYMYSVLADNQNRLWISHNNGVSCYDIKNNKTKHYNMSHGLQGNEFNTMAYLKKNDEEFYLGGTNGLNIFNPNINITQKFESKIVLEDFRIMDKTDSTAYFLRNNHIIKLPANQNTFSFTPILINYNNANNFSEEFKYKINGVDQDWVKGFSHQDVRYTGLPAGKHKLMLKTKDGTQKILVHVDVAQSIWKTWWFWLLFTMGLFILGYFLTRGYYKVKIIKQQAELDNHKALSNERLRIAQDMHDDVGTGLSRIRYIINSMKKDQKASDLNLNKIAEISDDTITKMGEIIWGLNESNQTLEELIFFIRANVSEMIENVNINFLSELPQTIPHCQLNWNQNRNVYLLVKETVNNAIKHAKAQTITLNFKLHKYLEITIKDDGVGFDPSATYQGNGLKNYKKRIAKLGGTYQINSDANGTIIIYQIPLSDKA